MPPRPSAGLGTEPGPFRKVLLVIMVSGSLLTGLIGGVPAVEGSHGDTWDTYAGTNTRFTPGFGYADGGGFKKGTTDAAVSLDPNSGTMRMLAHAWSTEGTTAYTEVEGRIGSFFELQRRCADQPATLEMRVIARYSMFGAYIESDGGDGDANAGTVVRALAGNTPGPGTSHGSGNGEWTTGPERTRPALATVVVGSHTLPAVEVRSHAWATNGGEAMEDHYTGTHAIQIEDIFIGWTTPEPSLDVSISSAQSSNGWHRAPATVATAAKEPMSCVETVTWTINGAENGEHAPGYDQTGTSFKVHETGAHELSVTATTYAHRSQTVTEVIQVDGVGPSSHATVVCKNSGPHCGDEATVEFSCADEHAGCSPSDTRYRVDKGPWQTGASVTVTQTGTHTVDHYAVDHVGNTGPADTVTVTIVCGGLTYSLENQLGICLPT